MKRTARISIGFFFLLIFSFTSAQTLKEVQEITRSYDIVLLNQQAIALAQKIHEEKENAIRFAQSRNLPLTYTTRDGGFAELQRIMEGGIPIYYRTENADAARSTRTNHLNSGGSTGYNLDGQNMTAYVWDGGHPRVSHREYKNDSGSSRVTIKDAPVKINFHAAHVVGTIAAKGVTPKAKGMAPKSTVHAYDWNSDLAEATNAATQGMLISNHSYGYDNSQFGAPSIAWIFGAYIDESRDWDQLMFNAPYYLMVTSAGNDGQLTNYNKSPLSPGYDILTGSKLAKNNLVIANANDAVVDNNGNLTSVSLNPGSSPGPADDLRIKPDITGNGTEVYSTLENSDSDYGILSGTSMSSPNVAGSLLLLQEHHIKVTGNYMKAATLKGLALHTADDAGPEGPDAKWGWGLLNAKKAAEAISSNGVKSLIQERNIAQGETITMEVTASGLEALKVSISWTDRAGTARGPGAANKPTPVLVNDLDVRVKKNTTSYFPWRLTSANTNSNGGDNKVDPFERVDVANATGTYTITISHKGQLLGGNQNFTLIVTGIDVEPCTTASIPSNIEIETTHSEARVTWSGTEPNFDLRYRKIGTTSWITKTFLSGNSYVIDGLSFNMDYELQLRSICNSSIVSDFSSSQTFRTKELPDDIDCGQGSASSGEGAYDMNGILADDFTVSPNKVLKIKAIEINIFVPNTAPMPLISFNVYNNEGNKPGNVKVASALNLSPTHANKVTTFGSYHIYQAFFAVDFTLEGGTNGTKYWLNPMSNTSNIGWEYTSSNTSGNRLHFFNGSWEPSSDPDDGVFTLHCEMPCHFEILNEVEPISRVAFAGFDHSSDPLINNSDGLEDFTYITGNVLKGEEYNITLEGNTGGAFRSYFTAWIDWDQDGIYSEDERYELGNIFYSTGIDGKKLSSTIAVPNFAKTGATKMRIIKNYDTSPINPCGQYDYGQAEDYSIQVNGDTLYVYENGAWTPKDPNGTATSSDNVLIKNGTALFNSNISIKNVTINSGATLEIQDVFNLYGNLLISGELVFKSTASKNGELGYVSPSSTITGDATVERYMKAVRSYRMVSSSVTTSGTIHENWQENAVSNTHNPLPGYGTHITGTKIDQQNGFDATETGNPSMFTVDYSLNKFVPVSDTDQSILSAGTPYLMFIRGDRSIDLNSNSSYGSTTLRAKGQLVTTDHTQNFSTGGANNFVMFGNPYQSAVDINTVISNSTKINPGHYYVYDPSISSNGGYVTVLLPSGTNSLSSEANEFLQPGQAAQFETTAAGALSVKFTPSAKAPGEFSGTNLRGNELNESDQLMLRLFADDNYQSGKKPHDAIGIIFGNEFDNAVTDMDASKPFNFNENLAVQNGDHKLSIEFRNLPNAGETYTLFTNGYSRQNYTFVGLKKGLADYNLILVDAFTGSATELGEETLYSFMVDAADELSIAPNRFSIHTESRLGIGLNDKLSLIRIYPNPLNSERLYLYAPELVGEEIGVKLHDQLGRTVIESKLHMTSGTMTIPSVEKLSSGVYIITISHKGETRTIQMIKE